MDLVHQLPLRQPVQLVDETIDIRRDRRQRFIRIGRRRRRIGKGFDPHDVEAAVPRTQRPSATVAEQS